MKDKKKLKPLDYKELYQNKLKQINRFIIQLSEFKEENKNLKYKLEKAKETLNSIRWMGHPERKQIYPAFDIKRCPTCTSAEVAHLALEEIEK